MLGSEIRSFSIYSRCEIGNSCWEICVWKSKEIPEQLKSLFKIIFSLFPNKINQSAMAIEKGFISTLVSNRTWKQTQISISIIQYIVKGRKHQHTWQYFWLIKVYWCVSWQIYISIRHHLWRPSGYHTFWQDSSSTPFLYMVWIAWVRDSSIDLSCLVMAIWQ